MALLKAPFPWPGGKSRVAHIVWPRFGDVLNYVEPFAGSLAMLLARPFPARTETVNDDDAMLANFWRSVQADPDTVAFYADSPVNEADLHARHRWLISAIPQPKTIPPEFDTPELQAAYLAGWHDSYNPNDPHAMRERLMSDPHYYDAKVAGWWVWGLSAWIGSGWCDIGEFDRNNGKRINLPQGGGRGVGSDTITRNGRTRPNLRPAQGVQATPKQQRPDLPKRGGRGVSRQIPHLNGDSGAAGAGIHASAFDEKTGGLYAYMRALQARLRHVRVVCGDWTRILGPSATYKIGVSGIFFDPPYDPDVRQGGLYSVDDKKVDGVAISTKVREWCLEVITDGKRGSPVYFKGPRYLHPKLRIAICGYEGEGHEVLESLGWDVVAWKANGGLSNQNKEGNDNATKERIWFSPNCLHPAQQLTGITDGRDYSDLFEAYVR